MGCASFTAMETDASDPMTNKMPIAETNVSEPVITHVRIIEVKTSEEAATPGATPIKIAVWPNTTIFPHNMNVYGLSLGLPISFDDQPYLFVAGLDMALLNANAHLKVFRCL